MELTFNGFWPTLLLLALVCAGGLALIQQTARRFDDATLLKIRYVFITKVIIVIALGFVWDYQVRTDKAELKGDQERYYHQAIDVGRAGLTRASVINGVQNINYPGILYIYGALFRIFGENVFSAALFNTFPTLLTTLLLIRVAYRIKKSRDRFDWTLGLMMLVPDVLCCDVMTSRDTLAMSLVAIPVLLVADFLLRADGNAWLTLLVVAVCFVLLAAVRTTALIPAVASVIVLLVKFRSRVKLRTIALVSAAALFFLLVAPKFSEYLGGYRMTVVQIMKVTVINPGPKFINAFTWTSRSIGQLLIPKSVTQAVLFAVPRMIAYLIIPLPAVRMPGSFDWTTCQGVLAASSSILYLAIFPFALVATKRDESMALVAPFWLAFLTVAGGTAVLQERYRVMIVPFLCGCVWLGRMASRRQLIGAYLAWGLILATGAVAAIAYKYA